MDKKKFAEIKLAFQKSKYVCVRVDITNYEK